MQIYQRYKKRHLFCQNEYGCHIAEATRVELGNYLNQQVEE